MHWCTSLLGTAPGIQAKEDSGSLTVYTVNYPLQYFAQRIAGHDAKVVFPAPAEGDPAFWTPDAQAVAEFQHADLILLNGANYAKWLGRVSLPRFRLVDTSAGFKDNYIVTTAGVSHSHGPGGEHAHAGTAFTTWLDFSQAAEQAKAVMQALSRKLPQHAARFEQNYSALEQELLALDAEIKALVDRNPDQLLVASHPVYQYFARRYGAKLESVLWEPEVPPDKQQWAELKRLLDGHPAKWMIWEGEPNQTTVKRLKSIGVSSLVFNPCANVPENDDFMGVMQRNIENMAAVFQSISR